MLGVALSGCAGGDGGPNAVPQVPGSAVFGEGSATLRGQVVDMEQLPVEGALIGVGSFDPLTTDEAGQFEATGLEAGTYRIEVTAPGYVSVSREVRLQEGQERQEQFQLERLPSVEPYIEVLQFRGTSACDYMFLVFSGRLSDTVCQGSDNQFLVNVTEGWQFLVVEQVWQSSTSTSEWFRVFAADDGDCVDGSPCYGLVYGDGYARFEGEPGKTDLVTYYDPWGDGRGPPYPNGSFDMFINSQWIGLLVEETNSLPGDPCQVILQTATGSHYKPGCLGYGVSTGVVFDLWVSIFVNQPPPNRVECCPATDYSALPDS